MLIIIVIIIIIIINTMISLAVGARQEIGQPLREIYQLLFTYYIMLYVI